MTRRWSTLSDLAMEQAQHDWPLFREFAGPGGWSVRLAGETTIPRFLSSAWRAQTGAEASADRQRVVARQGVAAARRHGGRCHADYRAELDQER